MLNSLPSVLLLHNLPGAACSSTQCAESDADVLDQANCVADALTKLGIPHRMHGVSTIAEIVGMLASAPERIVFNLVECLGPHDNATIVPALCTAYGKGCTGGDTSCLELTLNKWRSKAVLRAAGLPVLDDVLVPVGEMPAPARIPKGTLVVKPVATDGSEGLCAVPPYDQAPAELEAAVAKIHRLFKQPAIVEPYFGTREFAVPVFQRGDTLEVLAIGETDFTGFPDGMPRIVDYKAKWIEDSFEYRNTNSVIPALLDPGLRERLTQTATAAWRVMECRDYARVDARGDAHGNIAILEVNSNPDIADDGGYAVSCSRTGILFEQFVNTLITNAAARIAP